MANELSIPNPGPFCKGIIFDGRRKKTCGEIFSQILFNITHGYFEETGVIVLYFKLSVRIIKKCAA